MRALTYLVDLGQEECADLLASSPLGRLGVVVDGRPEIFPVSHVYDAATGTLAFVTNARTKLRAALKWPWVAFEVDGLDAGGRRGWSVCVVGRAETITDPEETARLAASLQVVWAAGEAAQWVRIVPDKITGRRISSPDECVEVRLP